MYIWFSTMLRIRFAVTIIQIFYAIAYLLFITRKYTISASTDDIFAATRPIIWWKQLLIVGKWWVVDASCSSEYGSWHSHGPVGLQVLWFCHGNWMGALQIPLDYIVFDIFMLITIVKYLWHLNNYHVCFKMSYCLLHYQFENQTLQVC